MALESMALTVDVICTLTHPYLGDMKFHFMSHWIFTNGLALCGTKFDKNEKRIHEVIAAAKEKLCSDTMCASCASENVLDMT